MGLKVFLPVLFISQALVLPAQSAAIASNDTSDVSGKTLKPKNNIIGPENEQSHGILQICKTKTKLGQQIQSIIFTLWNEYFAEEWSEEKVLVIEVAGLYSTY